MLCEKCNKNPATVFLENNFNNVKSEYHLCAECAQEINMQFDFANIINSLFGAALVNPPETTKGVRCEKCGLSLSDFRRLGKFGCASCYSAFEPQTEMMLKNIQGQLRHNGKIPNRLQKTIGVERELERLKLELRNAIESEEYEAAAILRDKIKSVQAETGKEA